MQGLATAPAPQHMQALARANRVRLARAELKRQVAEGELSVADVVLSCPWEAHSMAIADLSTSSGATEPRIDGTKFLRVILTRLNAD